MEKILVENKIVKEYGVPLKKIIALGALVLFILLALNSLRTSLFGEVSEEKYIYMEIVFLLLIAAVADLIFDRHKQPSVLVLMILGILVSASFLELAFETMHGIFPFVPSQAPELVKIHELLDIFAKIGAVLILFKAGLESKTEEIFNRENFFIGFLGILFPFIAGYLYASMQGGSFIYAMFLGATLTATSVGVTVAVLKEFKVMQERFAKAIIGAAVIDDVFGLIVLSLVMNVADSSSISILLLAQILITVVVFFVGGLLFGNYFNRYLDAKQFNERRFVLSLAFVLFYSFMAEFLGLSAIVGAFLSGMVLARSSHKEIIDEKFSTLAMLFAPMFFISLGIKIDIGSLSIGAVEIAIITAIAAITKFAGCWLASLASKMNLKESALVGIGMIPRAEVGLIIASIGLGIGALTQAQYSILASVSLLTTLFTPWLLKQIMNKKDQG